MRRPLTTAIYIPLITLWLMLSLTSCVPTMASRPVAPEFQGQLLSVQSLQPIAGAHIHLDKVLFPTPQSLEISGLAKHSQIIGTTTPSGQFRTNPPHSRKMDILMPAHRLTLYRAEAWHPEYRTLVLAAYGSAKLLRSETIDFDVLFMDSEPEVIAPVSTPNGSALNTLRRYFYHHSLLGDCDAHLGSAALDYTNSFRKLHHKLSQSTTENKKQLTYYSEAARQYASHLWAATEASCSQSNNPEKTAVFDSVFDELGRWPNKTSTPKTIKKL